jgi:predicted nucleotidyltransferase
MINIEDLKVEIVKRLEPLNIDKIILFGSYAHGTPSQDSDIDLYVVTNDNFTPQSFKESMNIKLKISRAIKDLQKTIPIDIITHTKKMHKKFVALNSSFSKEILENGVKLYG